MKIVDLVAYPVTVPVPEAFQARLGIGRIMKSVPIGIDIATQRFTLLP
jgi:hypothetical protein